MSNPRMISNRIIIMMTVLTMFSLFRCIPVSVIEEPLPAPLPVREGYLSREEFKDAFPVIIPENIEKTSGTGHGKKKYNVYVTAAMDSGGEEIPYKNSSRIDFSKEFEKIGIKILKPVPRMEQRNRNSGNGDIYFTPPVGAGILTRAELKACCDAAGAEFGVDPAYLEAIAETESGLNRYAKNGSHYGLFQISSHWHAERMAALGVTDIYDPMGNTRVAASYIRDLSKENPDPAYILMCYNQGQKSAVPMYNSGRISGYASKIIRRRDTIAKEGYLGN